MAKQIIILDRLNEPSDMTFRYVLWATVPVARVAAYADAAKTSAFKDVSAPELAALQAGQIAEKVDVFQAPIGIGIAAIQAALIVAFNTWQARVNATNSTQRYGTFWDGATWTVAGTN